MVKPSPLRMRAARRIMWTCIALQLRSVTKGPGQLVMELDRFDVLSRYLTAARRRANLAPSPSKKLASS